MRILNPADFVPEREARCVPNAMRSLTILVVEDEPSIGIDLASILHDGGADAVGPIASLPKALSAVFNVHIDGAIIDLVLYGDLSFDVADLLDVACIPFVFYTGLDTRLIPHRHRNVLCLQKPLAATHVVRRLLTMLDK